MSERYWVVFEGKPKSKSPHFRTWCGFKSPEDFLKAMPELLKDSNIVAAGVTDKEAEQICKENRDLVTMYYANIGEAFNWETGKFTRFVFDNRSGDYERFYGPCPKAIMFIADSLESGRMKEPPPLHMVFNISTITPKSAGGILESA